MKHKVLGVGVNDADYFVSSEVDGKRAICPYYKIWHGMLSRCYSEPYLKDKPSYRGCTVHETWHSFMNFHSWMEKQDWKGKHLDKDLLVRGNRVYGPTTCIFVPPDVNTFMTESTKSRGKYLIGVHLKHENGRFIAACSSKYIGIYDTEDEAHHAYLIQKEIDSRILAGRQSDKRVADALILRYSNNQERKTT